MHGAATVRSTAGASRVVTTTTVVPVARRREPERDDADFVRIERPLVRAARNDTSLRVHSMVRSRRAPTANAGRSALAEYARCLIDPFDSWQAPARIPQRVGAPTSVFSVRQAYSVRGSAVGDGTYTCCALLSGGLQRFFAASTLNNTFAALPANKHTHLVQYDNTGNDLGWNDWPASSLTITRVIPGDEYLLDWDSIPTLAAVQASYTSYRPVCKGMRITYVGPKLTAAGSMAVGLLPGDRAPAGATANGSFAMASGASGDFPLTFEATAALLGAEVYDATCGATVVWSPQGDDIDEWRPTKYVPPTVLNLGTTLPTCVSAFMGSDDQPFCIPCDGDPAEFKAMADDFAGPAFAMFANSLAPAPGGAMADIQTLSVRTNSTLRAVQSTSDPLLVMCAKNLTSDAAFEIEVIVTYEAISQSRDFSAVMPARGAVPPREIAIVRSIASSLPASTPGNARGYLARIASGVSSAVSLGKHLIDGVQQALPIAGNVMRALGLNTEAGLVEGISEGGPALIESLAPLAIAAV